MNENYHKKLLDDVLNGRSGVVLRGYGKNLHEAPPGRTPTDGALMALEKMAVGYILTIYPILEGDRFLEPDGSGSYFCLLFTEEAAVSVIAQIKIAKDSGREKIQNLLLWPLKGAIEVPSILQTFVKRAFDRISTPEIVPLDNPLRPLTIGKFPPVRLDFPMPNS